jgi:hypothetical protein
MKLTSKSAAAKSSNNRALAAIRRVFLFLLPSVSNAGVSLGW